MTSVTTSANEPPASPTNGTSTAGDGWSTTFDLPGIHRVLTGLERDSIEMREVSPMSGLLTNEQRTRAMATVA